MIKWFPWYALDCGERIEKGKEEEEGGEKGQEENEDGGQILVGGGGGGEGGGESGEGVRMEIGSENNALSLAPPVKYSATPTAPMEPCRW